VRRLGYICLKIQNGVVAMNRLDKIFPGMGKILIAMAHVPPLPGTPLYDASAGVQGLIDRVKSDTEKLLEAGFDAILFCNEGDRPYTLQAGLEASAVMTRVVTECKPRETPFGIDYLWDANAALAIAVATDAHFMREVITGTWESDMGLWQPDAAKLLRNRRNFGREDLAIFANITPEFASAIGHRTPAQMAKSTYVSSVPDLILVSGPMAGAEPDISTLRSVREVLPNQVRVFLNTGAKSTNIAKFLRYADGCIVGSDLKRDGYPWNEVDFQRARRFLETARNM
jgi:membrane complex biogenesis BtpA family protein